jgi:transposase InsO family protein
MDVPHSSFCEWYRRYNEEGYDGLTSKRKDLRQVWNKIPEWEKERVVETAREYPEKSCREIAWQMTDKREYFISESSVYRILKAYDLITSPVFTVVSAKDKFEHPTTRTNELWQTDFMYLKIVHWGLYYLSTGRDDFSRYIIYYAPAELTERIREWVGYYNHQWYHEVIDNVTPADKYYGRERLILEKREKIRQETMKTRRELNRMAMLEALPNGVS